VLIDQDKSEPLLLRVPESQRIRNSQAASPWSRAA